MAAAHCDRHETDFRNALYDCLERIDRPGSSVDVEENQLIRVLGIIDSGAFDGIADITIVAELNRFDQAAIEQKLNGNDTFLQHLYSQSPSQFRKFSISFNPLI